MALGAKFISTKLVQCCGEKDSPLYCCYIAPPAPLKLRGKTKKYIYSKTERIQRNQRVKKSPFFPFCSTSVWSLCFSSIDKGRLMLSVQACNRHPVGSSGLSKVHTRRSQTVLSMIFTHLTMCVPVCVCVCVCVCVYLCVFLCECVLRVVIRIQLM